jgi:thioredoxin reductase (NADPH)
MIESSELGAVPLLAKVAPEDLVDLARSAGDVRLGTGEYAIHEGDERALFIVLDGNIEVVKSIDGIERRIGVRAPGQIFGAVPIIFGTPFQGGYRALQPARVARIEAARFYELAARSPDTLTQVAALARERIGGLQGIALTPAKVRATLIGYAADAACRELRAFLTRNQIKFDFLAPEAPDLATRWPGTALGPADLPALHCDDGVTLVRARAREVAQHLGLQTRPRGTHYDTVILGGGPAGLAAALYAASEGLRTIVIEREAPGGQAETSSRIENYLGFPTGVSGDELARRALQQAIRLGAEIMVTRRAAGIDVAARTVRLEDGESLSARTMILATGVSWRRLAVEGFDRLLGKGVFYGAARSEAGTTQGRDIQLLGAGNSAGQAALFFANHARSVTLVVRGSSLETSMSHYLVEQLRGKANIQVALRSEVQAVRGDDQRVPSTSSIARAARCGGRRAAAFSSSSAQTPRRGGCPTRSPATAAATCSRAKRWSRPGAGTRSGTRTCSRRACRGSSAAATCVRAWSSGWPPPSARAAWPSPSSTSSCNWDEKQALARLARDR